MAKKRQVFRKYSAEFKIDVIMDMKKTFSVIEKP